MGKTGITPGLFGLRTTVGVCVKNRAIDHDLIEIVRDPIEIYRDAIEPMTSHEISCDPIKYVALHFWPILS